jgi:ribosomal protein L37AE/L43A
MPKLLTVMQDINEVRAAYGILAPCPFCGSSEVEAVSRARGRVWFVVCTDCHATGAEPAAGHQGDPTNRGGRCCRLEPPQLAALIFHNAQTATLG